MSSIDYLNALAARGIELWTENGKLQYKAPKEAVTTELLAELKANKARLVELLEQFAGTSGTYPLSYSQKSLWSLHRLQPASAAYNVTYAAALVDDLDIALLTRCVDGLVARHPILRTRYVVEGDQPVQQVGRTAAARLTVDRVFGADEDAVRAWVDQEANRPFDLAASPIRLKLLVNELAPGASTSGVPDAPRHVLLLNVHHVAADFWSLEILVRELRALYDLARRGQPLKLPPVPLQHADCVQQEIDRLQGEDGRALAAFWDRELAGGLPALALATDRVRPPVKTENGRVLETSLGLDLTLRIKARAKALRVTPYMLLLSVYQLFLFLHTGQSRLPVGAPTAGRTTPGSEAVLGHFVNTIVIVAEAAPDLRFDALLDATRATMLRVLDHADFPFPLLVERLRPARDPSRSPLYQVMFNWNQRRAEGPAERPEHPLFERTLVASSTGTRGATHDLTLNVQDVGESYGAAWTWNTDLFEASTVQAFARQYRGLVEQVLADAGRPLAAYSLADAEERRAQFAALSHRLQRAAPGATLAADVAAMATAAPTQAAWRLGAQTITRDALAAAIRQLASRLRAAGIGPDRRVALQGLAAPDRAVALLALASLGASVLVHDAPDGASMPPEADAMLCGHGGSAASSAWHPDAIRIERTATPRAALARATDLASPARLDGFCRGVADALAIGVGTTVVMLDGTPAPLAAAALVAAAACGAVLVVPTAPTLSHFADITTADAAAQALRDVLSQDPAHPVTALLPAPLLPGLAAADVGRLRLLASFGDRPHLLRAWARPDTPPCRHLAQPGLDAWIGPVVLAPEGESAWRLVEPRHGYPLPVLLGATNDLAATGQAVRLHLVVDHASSEVADPAAVEMRLDRFRHHPDILGALALQSVIDLPFTVVRRPDGTLRIADARGEFADHGGVRGSPGLVEAALSSLPGVAEAHVDRRTADGATSCVAWVRDAAAATGADLWLADPEDVAARERELMRGLKARLPEPLLPDAIVLVDRFPLTPLGELAVDRLPAPRPRAEHARAASGEVEPQLAAIWREVLAREAIAVDDDFFALGGDSILAAVIVSKAGAAGLYLEPKDLFENPTIATLAEVVGRTPRIEAEQDAVTGDFDLAPAAAWFFERVTVDRSHFNQALLLGLDEALEPALMTETLRRLAARHDVLRSRFTERDGRWRHHVDDELAAVPASFAVVDARDARGGVDESRWQAAIDEAQSGLDIERGPLWAVRWLVGPTISRCRLLVVAHHLVIDGVSWSILLQDLGDTYTRLRAGAADRAVMKTTSAPAWVAHWAERARAGGLDADRAYWMAFADRVDDALADATRPIALMRHGATRRTDPVGPSAPRTPGLCAVTLDPELTTGFRTQAHLAYGTDANDLLAAALHAGFRAWGGSTGLLVDLEGHGRDALADVADLGRTVGWFTSIAPVLLEAPALEDGAGALVKHVKEHLRAMPAKGAGFGVLRHMAGATDDATRTRLAAIPPSPVIFTYLGALDAIAGATPLLGGAVEPAPGIRSARQPMTHLLDLCAYVADGRLTLEGRFEGGEAVEDSIGCLMQHVCEALEAIVRHCCSAEAGGFTPSDVPDLGLDQDGLDTLLDELDALDA
jgi:non-ribosomal peptide synthase protein (TIGR01720 family)